MNYGEFSKKYGHEDKHAGHFEGRRYAYLGDTRREPGQNYRLQHSREYGRQGGRFGTENDRYDEMYDISNYTAQPRSEEYGLPRSAENDLNAVGRYPLRGEGPYAGRRHHYRYSMGYNPNYDNPEEGDMYRDFDSRGNHGFRHDASYGYEDAFRDFESDRLSESERRGGRYYGYFGGYNR